MQYNSLSSIAPLYGLILCGGLSTRMGSDKSEIHYHNKSQREHLFDVLSLHCIQTFISCNASQSKIINNLQTIEDIYENAGPLGGILSAFQYNKQVAWLAIACDMPLLDEKTIMHLVNHRNTNKIATAFLNNKTKFVEPLVTIWEPQAYSLLLHFFKSGNKSPGNFLMKNDVELLSTSDNSAFRNVNTKKEVVETLDSLKSF